LVIAEDHPVVCAGLLDLFSHEDGIEVAGCAQTAARVLQLVRVTNPHLLLLDLGLGDDDGVALARRLLKDRPSLGILVLSMHEEELFAERLLAMGVRGYITKNRPREEFLNALHTVLRGEIYVTSEQRERFAARAGQQGPAMNPEARLSPRELSLLKLLASGKSTAAIAAALGMALKTVYSHRRNIASKLGIKSGREMVRYAVHWARSAE
jgi:DNA-binding NarL/FixJ family response regulator